MLPDMRGVEVCEHLQKNVRSSQIPVVVMSGKGVQIAEQFANFPAFHSALGKPATSEQIRAAIEAAVLASRKTASDKVSRSSTFQQREAVAKAIYSILREPLTQIPKWMNELGSQPTGPFFAKKILSSELIGKILNVVSTINQNVLSCKTREEKEDCSFYGGVRGWPISALVTFLEASGRTGELTLELDGNTVLIYVRSGEVIMVTNRDPSKYLGGPLPEVARRALTARSDVVAAETEQRSSGVPLFVTLAAAGKFPLSDLTETLRAISRKLLIDVAELTTSRFAFRELAVLPSYVEAHGRHVSIVRNTLCFGPDSDELAGKSTDSKASLSPPCEGLTTVRLNLSDQLERVVGFSEKIRGLKISANERRILTLVDGHSSAERIVYRSGLDREEVIKTLESFINWGLIHNRQSSNSNDDSLGRSMMILEPDLEGFLTPLATSLANRPNPIKLIDLSSEAEVTLAVQRERPQALLLNASLPNSLELVRLVRATKSIENVFMVALLEPQMEPDKAKFSALGFDEVWVKPIFLSDVERILH
jgi:CheY-like chemotaxis protein